LSPPTMYAERRVQNERCQAGQAMPDARCGQSLAQSCQSQERQNQSLSHSDAVKRTEKRMRGVSERSARNEKCARCKSRTCAAQRSPAQSKNMNNQGAKAQRNLNWSKLRNQRYFSLFSVSSSWVDPALCLCYFVVQLPIRSNPTKSGLFKVIQSEKMNLSRVTSADGFRTNKGSLLSIMLPVFSNKSL